MKEVDGLMKKYTTILLVLAMMIALAGCGGGNQAETPAQSSSQPTTQADKPADTTPMQTTQPTTNEAAGPTLPEFSTVDINAYTVDSSILAEKKLTMVSFWATYCFYCKEEMPGLGNLARSMPEGSQIIGVVTDAYDEQTILAARDIVADNKADYPHLLIDEGLLEYLPNVRVLPTTVFFDSEGRQVGEIIEGMMSEEEHRAEIEQRLAGL